MIEKEDYHDKVYSSVIKIEEEERLKKEADKVHSSEIEEEEKLKKEAEGKDRRKRKND